MFLWYIVFGCVAVANGFPNGAKGAAENGPKHGKNKPQPSESLPYELCASQAEYHPGQTVQVTISSPITNFKGFYIEARDCESNAKIGVFQPVASANVLLDGNAITHADNKDKTQAGFIWNAPQHKSGQVYFIASIVKNFKTFWTQIRSTTHIRNK